MHFGTGPYHKVAGYLVENDDCKVDTKKFSQLNCPEENKNGFYLNEEMLDNWDDLNQTQILVFHSWINEYVRVANVTNENGRNKVMFQEPLSHAPIGMWVKPGGLRYLVVNNLAVLDMPGRKPKIFIEKQNLKFFFGSLFYSYSVQTLNAF